MLIKRDDFAIQNGLFCWQSPDGLKQPGKSRTEIIGRPRLKRYVASVLNRERADAIKLNFVKPFRPDWKFCGKDKESRAWLLGVLSTNSKEAAVFHQMHDAD